MTVPETPVTITLYRPVGAVLLAVRVITVEPVAVGFGEKDAVTPVGKPDTAKFTLPVDPDWEAT